MVPEEGIEPTLPYGNAILSRARLPVPPLRLEHQPNIYGRLGGGAVTARDRSDSLAPASLRGRRWRGGPGWLEQAGGGSERIECSLWLAAIVSCWLSRRLLSRSLLRGSRAGIGEVLARTLAVLAFTGLVRVVPDPRVSARALGDFHVAAPEQ